MDMSKIKIGISTLTGKPEMYLFRHGKDPNCALDKRPCEADVMGALVTFMMHNSPKGSIQEMTIGKRKYRLTLTPIRGK